MAEALRVLLVEDNEGDVEMTQRALRDAKPVCKISVANDGIEALAFLTKEGDFAAAETPQLILLDLNMPRMDGKKFLETIKAEARFKAIPVVMLTSSESPQDVRACYERYASSYVVKPFDAKEFTTRVRQVVTFWGETGRLPN
jgi:CheY-like chemotaxis protein